MAVVIKFNTELVERERERESRLSNRTQAKKSLQLGLFSRI